MATIIDNKDKVCLVSPDAGAYKKIFDVEKIFKIKKKSYKTNKDENIQKLESSIIEKIGLNVLIKNKNIIIECCNF